MYEIILQVSEFSDTTEELLGNHLGEAEVIGNIYEHSSFLLEK
ncbi:MULTISPECIES: hypothetical protein [Cytobacillus]|nr:hypothetical protein [Cytobacillus kochii]